MQRAPADQKAEFTALEEELISNSLEWERIKNFVDVENPIRQLMRVSDGHVPNLSSIALGYDLAKGKCTAAIAAAEVKYPDVYAGLNIVVTHLLEKRRRDIVTPLCLAAAMVVPGLVYIEEGKDAYDPEGGKEALLAIIDRYYLGDIAKQVEALKVYQDFRDRSGQHFGNERMKYMAVNDSADEFWKVSTLFATEGSELFRKLVNGYRGNQKE